MFLIFKISINQLFYFINFSDGVLFYKNDILMLKRKLCDKKQDTFNEAAVYAVIQVDTMYVKIFIPYISFIDD